MQNNPETRLQQFKRELLPQLELAKEQGLEVDQVNCSWLKRHSIRCYMGRLFNQGEIMRCKNPKTANGLPYRYFLPQVETGFVSSGLNLKELWERVMVNVSPYVNFLLKGSRLVARKNKEFIIELSYDSNTAKLNIYKIHLMKILAKLLGGEIEDYSVTYVFPAINFKTQEILVESPNQIKQPKPDPLSPTEVTALVNLSEKLIHDAEKEIAVKKAKIAAIRALVDEIKSMP
ncbi:MAG: hypothetical protein VKL20_08880 [Synechocystis sp.]|nr:hypothetical protein [Synechocystis sp.]